MTDVKIDTVTCNAGYMGEKLIMEHTEFLLGNLEFHPAPYQFQIYQETALTIGLFQKAHPEIDVNPIINKAILSELEKEEAKLNARKR